MGHGDTPICRFGSEFRACGSHCAEAESWDPVPLALPCSLVPLCPGPMSAPTPESQQGISEPGARGQQDSCVCVCVCAHMHVSLGRLRRVSHCRGLEKKHKSPEKEFFTGP